MDVNERLDRALAQLARGAEVPPEDPARVAALLAAFDAKPSRAQGPRRDLWWMTALAAAAGVLVAVALAGPAIGRHDPSSQRAGSHTRASDLRGVQPPSPDGFVMVPGAAALPSLENGTLVRMELPVSILPSLGMMPPATGHATEVTADIIVGQDGLPRAVRLVE